MMLPKNYQEFTPEDRQVIGAMIGDLCLKNNRVWTAIRVLIGLYGDELDGIKYGKNFDFNNEKNEQTDGAN